MYAAVNSNSLATGQMDSMGKQKACERLQWYFYIIYFFFSHTVPFFARLTHADGWCISFCDELVFNSLNPLVNAEMFNSYWNSIKIHHHVHRQQCCEPQRLRERKMSRSKHERPSCVHNMWNKMPKHIQRTVPPHWVISDFWWLN